MPKCCITGCSHNHQTKFRCLKGLHNCCILCGQIIASTILISLTLWLLFRQIEPSAYVNNFELGALKDIDSRLVHYDITLHNPDIYKSIIYDSLALRIWYKGSWLSRTGITIDFVGFTQGPRQSKLLTNHTADTGYTWEQNVDDIRAGKYPFELRLVMMVRYMFYNRVIASRQIMRVADVYFDSEGRAFIDHHAGLRFK